VVTTEMEHHSNIVPWYLAARRAGATLDWVAVDDQGRLDRDSFTRALEKGPKAVGLTHVSNVLGTVNPVVELVAEARSAGAMTLVDGAQAAPRIEIDVEAIGSDFYVFTGHKLYGPTGIGVLFGRSEVLDVLEPFEGGGSMISKVGREEITWARPPTRFEAGTPMIAEAVGLDSVWFPDHLLYAAENADPVCLKARYAKASAHIVPPTVDKPEVTANRASSGLAGRGKSLFRTPGTDARA